MGSYTQLKNPDPRLLADISYVLRDQGRTNRIWTLQDPKFNWKSAVYPWDRYLLLSNGQLMYKGYERVVCYIAE